jgi:hypothetical protein
MTTLRHMIMILSSDEGAIHPTIPDEGAIHQGATVEGACR